jgi:hypothetical protein
MQIQGFEVKLDDAALAWRETKYAGIRWMPLYEAPLSESSSRGGEADALGSHRAADSRDAARGAEANALGSRRAADSRDSARGAEANALGSHRAADSRDSARGAEANALGSHRAADSRDSARGPRESTVLIRMAPGCGYPAHRHLDVEEVLILRGGYRDEDGEHRAGAYLRYAPGSVHCPVALGDPRRPEGPDNQACVLFAVARGGVSNVG